MARARFCPARWCLASVVLALCAVGTAAAQTTTINQTSCIDGTGSCLTGGLLQDLAVDCNAAGSSGRLSTALSSIADRSGPNRITVSGTCRTPGDVVGFNRLTIQGTGGATITGFNVVNSWNVTLRSLTFTLEAGGSLGLQHSGVILDGVTIRSSSAGNGVNVGGGSTLGFSGAPSLITGNVLDGINVGHGSGAHVTNVTITNNGGRGIYAHDGGSVSLSNQIVVNGVLVDAPVDISGNARQGVLLQASELSIGAEGGSPSALIHIHDNTCAGLAVFASRAVELLGNIQFDGNGSGNCDGLGTAQVVAFASGTMAIGEGAQVLGGLAAQLNSFVVIGDSGGMTITGGVTFGHGSTGLLSGTNSIDVLNCDTTSWVTSDGSSIIGMNNCTTFPPDTTSGSMPFRSGSAIRAPGR